MSHIKFMKFCQNHWSLMPTAQPNTLQVIFNRTTIPYSRDRFISYLYVYISYKKYRCSLTSSKFIFRQWLPVWTACTALLPFWTVRQAGPSALNHRQCGSPYWGILHNSPSKPKHHKYFFSQFLFFCILFWRARVCQPFLCLCRPFMIIEGCLDSNPEYCRNKLARYRLSHPSL